MHCFTVNSYMQACFCWRFCQSFLSCTWRIHLTLRYAQWAFQECLFTWATRRMHLFAWTTFTLQPNSPLLLRETDYCYKTITFHSYILFEFNQFIDTCIIICVYFLFIPFCIFVYSESVYIFIFDACCFSAILVCVSYH